jgi:hypothetical protein
MSNQNNPSIQCSVCGRWMRLHGKDDQGQAIQRFYGCCEDEVGNHYDHKKEVCDDCCKEKCPYRATPITESFYKRHNYKYFEGKEGITLRTLKNNAGTVIEKGEKIKMEKRHRGFYIWPLTNRKNVISRVHYKDVAIFNP